MLCLSLHWQLHLQKNEPDAPEKLVLEGISSYWCCQEATLAVQQVEICQEAQGQRQARPLP